MTAEDFSYFLLDKPGAYFVIGNGDGRHRLAYGGDPARPDSLGPCTLHNPHYDFNDDLIPLGATLWINLVERWFSRPR
jgi:hippurate hydrolase